MIWRRAGGPLLVATLVVALAILPAVRIVEMCRARLFDESPLTIHVVPRTVEIDVGGPPIYFPAPEDKMLVIPFGREPDELPEL